MCQVKIIPRRNETTPIEYFKKNNYINESFGRFYLTYFDLFRCEYFNFYTICDNYIFKEITIFITPHIIEMHQVILM